MLTDFGTCKFLALHTSNTDVAGTVACVVLFSARLRFTRSALQGEFVSFNSIFSTTHVQVYATGSFARRHCWCRGGPPNVVGHVRNQELVFGPHCWRAAFAFSFFFPAFFVSFVLPWCADIPSRSCSRLCCLENYRIRTRFCCQTRKYLTVLRQAPAAMACTWDREHSCAG